MRSHTARQHVAKAKLEANFFTSFEFRASIVCAGMSYCVILNTINYTIGIKSIVSVIDQLHFEPI
jgi:hypothetical protein